MTHPYDRCCEHLLDRFERADAKAWIEDQSHGPRVIWEFDTDESRYIIGNIYARGASDVLVLGEEDAISNHGSVDFVLITLPTDAEPRASLIELENMVAEEHGFDGAIDEGQRYALLRWT